VDPNTRRALTDFYREEFLAHLEHLQATGIVNDGNREIVDRTCKKLMKDLDRVCVQAEFRQVAETLLQSFDTLSGLSSLDPRQRH
jgi:hypothetical protein